MLRRKKYILARNPPRTSSCEASCRYAVEYTERVATHPSAVAVITELVRP
jgi:hypothetical protein